MQSLKVIGKLSAFTACPHLPGQNIESIHLKCLQRREFLTLSKSRARCTEGGAGRRTRPSRTARMTLRSRVHSESSCV